MANLFNISGTMSILGHCIRISFDCNTLYDWFDYEVVYDESINGIRAIFELCKIQLFIGIGSNVQDTWSFDSDILLMEQDHDTDARASVGILPDDLYIPYEPEIEDEELKE